MQLYSLYFYDDGESVEKGCLRNNLLKIYKMKFVLTVLIPS
jgi:hypothetical protein